MFAVDTASDTLVSKNFTDYCARVCPVRIGCMRHKLFQGR